MIHTVSYLTEPAAANRATTNGIGTAASAFCCGPGAGEAAMVRFTTGGAEHVAGASGEPQGAF